MIHISSDGCRMDIQWPRLRFALWDLGSNAYPKPVILGHNAPLESGNDMPTRKPGSFVGFSLIMGILTSIGERANHIDPLGILKGA